MKALSFGPPPSPSAGRKRQQLGTIAANKQQQEVGGKLVTQTTGDNDKRHSDNDSASGSDRENSQARRAATRNTRNPANNKVSGVFNSEKDDAMDIVTASTSTGSMGEQSLAEMLLQKTKQPAASTSSAPRPKKRKLAARRRRAHLHIEVALSANSRHSVRHDILERAVYEFIHANFDSLIPESLIVDWEEVGLLAQYVDTIRVAESTQNTDIVYLREVDLKIHIYRPSQNFIVDSFTAAPTKKGGEDDDDDDHQAGQGSSEDNEVMAATVAHLPAQALEGIWDNLIYDDNIKQNLLNYIHATQLFGDKQVDFNVITWNRLVLLHGPPGTGKTSLCRALAQKLAIRLSDRYTHGKLVEINSHSIMSKWFSESGKLVQRLFTRVLELVEDQECFVVVLIDEVESLTTARDTAMSGKEPSDAVRVVNALLTQLDKLKNKKNVLVMTTSNLSGAIDSAFVDRADVKQYIGLPPVQAVYWILLGCLRELMRSGIIRPSELLEWRRLKAYNKGYDSITPSTRQAVRNSQALGRLAELCHGMSGRTLRRIPVLAHARYIASGAIAGFDMDTEEHWQDGEGAYESDEGEESESTVDDEEMNEDGIKDGVHIWLHAMLETVKKEKEQMLAVENGNGSVR